MKLLIFDRNDLSARAENKKPALRIYKHQVVLYPELCNIMGIEPGDRVKFAQDKDRPADWYLCKDNENGVVVKKYCKTKAMCAILGTFLRAVPEHWRKQTILVGAEAVQLDGLDWYPMITAALNTTESIMQQAKEKPAKDELFNARSQY